MEHTWLLAAALLAGTAALCAEKPSPGPMSFTLEETSGLEGDRLATVSMPFALGEVAGLEGASVEDSSGAPRPVQCRVLKRHPDGSIRRALIRFPWQPKAEASETFTLTWQGTPASSESIITAAGPFSVALSAGPRSMRLSDNGLAIQREGRPECRVRFTGLGFPSRFLGPEVTVIEDGPYFAWFNLTFFSGQWNVYMEVQADYTGQVRIIARLRLMRGTGLAAPRFGLELSGLAPVLSAPEAAPLPFSATVADGGPRRFAFGLNPGATVLTIPPGAQVRQGRVDVQTTGDTAQLTFTRDASLDDTVADEQKQFYEGQERHVELVLPRPGGKELGCRASIAAVRRSAAVLGLPLVDWGPLTKLRETCTRNALKLTCRDGDQFGDVTSGVSLSSPQWSITGLTRIDTGLDMVQDYYRGGDPRLKDMAVGWAENWVSLKQYRGWDMNSFGGERYTMAAWDYIPSFNQKGVMMIAYAYEETGDPRYLESALAFADRAVRQMQTRYFLSGSGVSPLSIGSDANIRPGYLGRDLVLMYRWTADERYLNAARQIVHGLATLCTGEHGLLREGYGDPYSPFERLVTGTDLGVTEDNSDHLKPFILNYILEGAQYLYEETGDAVAGSTMVGVSEFMLDAMQEGGIWNYAQRHAAEGNGLGHMSVEIANTLLRSYSLTGDERYRTAAFEAYHLICKCLETYGTMVDGVTAPADRSYFYPDDHCDLDLYRGAISVQGIGRDAIGYFLCAVDRILRIDGGSADWLLSPPTHPRHRWLVEQAPVSGGTVNHEIGHCYIASMPLGKDGDRESKGKSDLVLLEDGRPLGPPHCLHADIREQGRGRYSHWTRNTLYFSAGDNSDPGANGRRYAFYFGSPDEIPEPDGLRTIETSGSFSGRKPHESVALYQEGLSKEQQGRYEEAIAVWQQVLQRWPDSAPELYRQIDLWRKAGNEMAMLQTCRRFVQTFPDSDRAPSVNLLLAEHLIADGRTDEARKTLRAMAAKHGTDPWGEVAAVRLWHELGVGPAPPTVVHATPGTEPSPAPVTALNVSDGLPSALPLEIGAAHDDTNLYIRLIIPLESPWPSPEAAETFRLILDARGEMTDYQLLIVNSQGSLQQRGLMWHNRGQGIEPAEGWGATVARAEDGWTADLTIPFAKIGFEPRPGHRQWRLGFRWDSLSGMKLWRPAIPNAIRPHDCGWLIFD